MGRNHNILSFKMDDSLLRFDLETSILLCQSKVNGKKQWVKKLNDLNVSDIFEDNKRYYVVCDSGEINGQFLAVNKENGTTSWFIPGKSFLHVLYKGFLFLIFADEINRFYLLKVNIGSGKSAWFHPVDPDLFEYIFSNDAVKLKYFSGKTESLALKTGKIIN
jgi:outer membrane protein assembly factor BamB